MLAFIGIVYVSEDEMGQGSEQSGHPKLGN